MIQTGPFVNIGQRNAKSYALQNQIGCNRFWTLGPRPVRQTPQQLPGDSVTAQH